MSDPASTYWYDQRYEDELLHQHRTTHVDVAKPLSCHWCANELTVAAQVRERTTT